MIVAAFKPQFPAIVPNPGNVIEQAQATKCDYMFITPTFIEVNPLVVIFFSILKQYFNRRGLNLRSMSICCST